MPTSQVELVWKAVQARHQQFHLPPPMCEANQFSSWSKLLGSIRGHPVALKLPIHPEGNGALVARVAAELAGRPQRSAADGGGSETFTNPIASCLQSTILAPTPARPPRPAAWFTAIRHFG